MSISTPRFLAAAHIGILFCLFAAPAMADPPRKGGGPCEGSITRLLATYDKDPAFHELILKAFANMKRLPAEYPQDNPWIGKNIHDLADFFEEWCVFLPTIQGSHDNGLDYIQHFAWFYYQNDYGVDFVQKEPGREITRQFAIERGKYLWSAESATVIPNWLQDARVEIKDYDVPGGGFTSFNEFFARTLKDQAKSRPQTMPDLDYVISAPTDCIMNSIPQRIESAATRIPTKFRQALNIHDLLDGSKYAAGFIGGTALSCVLMPNTYHHFHAPVSGHVVEARIVKDSFYGYDDFPRWVPLNGNVGYYGTDFSEFENFQRGYFIVDTGKYGHVALIAVGLDTISSIVFEEPFRDIKQPVKVARGDMLGNFYYGGSLFIMVFEPGRYQSGAVQVRLGNQIGLFDTKSDKP
jgi:phosphatidylserine decarboxylase